MNPLRYHPKITVMGKQQVDELFESFPIKPPKLVAKRVVLPLGVPMRIEWACAWNKVSNVGKICTIIATNDQICLVHITSGRIVARSMDIYRCEDLFDLHEERKTIKLVESLGLPTFKL